VIEAMASASLAARSQAGGGGPCETFACGRTSQAKRWHRWIRADFAGVAPLSPPFKAARVTGALSPPWRLAVESARRVLVGTAALANLFAAGGAAAGVSGSKASGYLSGNGLMRQQSWAETRRHFCCEKCAAALAKV